MITVLTLPSASAKPKVAGSSKTGLPPWMKSVSTFPAFMRATSACISAADEDAGAAGSQEHSARPARPIRWRYSAPGSDWPC